jgi:topoisomerase-4 subunit A
LKEAGVSTLKPRKIWFDKVVMRLNTEERGELIGEFSGDDQLVLITQDGRVAKFVPDMEKHFPENMIILEKYEKGKPITAAYFDKDKNRYFIKRFLIDDLKKEEAFIPENANLLKLSTDWLPVWELHFGKERGKKQKDPQQIDVEEFISIKGVKAQGNLLSKIKIKQVEELPSKPYKSDENIEQIDDVVEEEVENIPFEIKIPEQEEIVEEEEPKKPNNNEPPTLF